MSRVPAYVPPPLATERHDAASLVPIDSTRIRQLTDSGSYSRGRGYARGGRIFNPSRRGTMIQARCLGSSGGPYRVEAILATTDQPEASSPVAIRCNCPRGGFCKHVVALLLTWIEAPESFTVHPPLAEVLAEKSREELIGLIELMLRDQPELEVLLKLPPPVAGPPGEGPADEAALRRQIEAALGEISQPMDEARYGYGYGYGNGYGYDRYPYADDYGEYPPGGSIAADALARVIELGKAYAGAEQWSNALTVYATFVEQVAAALGDIQHTYQQFGYEDDDGIPLLLAECDRSLATLLDMQATLPDDQRLTRDERERLIEALYAIWFADVELGGPDIAMDGPESIGRQATPAEREKIGDWLRQLIAPANSERRDDDDMNRAALWFLSLLGPEGGLSDEELLDAYREAGLWEEAAELLLRLHRVEEAIALAGRHLTTGYSLVQFADTLVATGDEHRTEQAITLVDDCLWEREGRNVPDDHLLSTWLEQHYARQGHIDRALALARRRFAQVPSRATYDAVKTLASLPEHTGEDWSSLRPALIKALRAKEDWFTLMGIHLEEGEPTDALAIYKRTQSKNRGNLLYHGYYGSGDYGERIAAAVAPTLPDEAVAIYRSLADRMIQHRKREYYQQAARYLAEVKTLLEENDRAADWSTLITNLRGQHKTLRALREELSSLGLE